MILGKAATLYEDLEAVMTQSYGPEARGGASSADVILADAPIAYPFVQQADILVALSQEAYKKYRPLAKKDALVLIDRDLVQPNDGDKVHAIPSTHLAEELGRRIVTNIVMLGFLTAVTGLGQTRKHGKGTGGIGKGQDDTPEPEGLCHRFRIC